MPARNTLKNYVPESYYHIYNRGAGKQSIYLDEQDYRVFLSYFKFALTPGDTELASEDESLFSTTIRPRRLQLGDEIELLAYCLMPSHFHIFIYQHSEFGIRDLIRSVMTGYSMYFNKRHEQKGHLFEGPYKAVRIENESYLWHISRYIHLNPVDLGVPFENYEFSSYGFYTGQKEAPWLNPQRILSLHKEYSGNYQDFVEDYTNYRQTLKEVKEQLAD